MGRFVNPENSAFQVALNSEIYVDKTGLIAYTNKVLNTKQLLSAIAVRGVWQVGDGRYACRLLQPGM